MWNAQSPSVADINKIRRVIQKIDSGSVVRLGGMTDCFQPLERKEQVTRQTIQELNKRGIHQLIVTKSAMVAEYTDVLDKDLSHIQITVTTLDDAKSKEYEKASPPSERIKAILKLQELGYDVAIRLSPLIENNIDFERLNNLQINKAVVEFLRVNHWIKKWFDADYSQYTIKESGYQHLPLDQKKRILQRIKIPIVTVCEDVNSHYEYWRDNFNPNSRDCCNLRGVSKELHEKAEQNERKEKQNERK